MGISYSAQIIVGLPYNELLDVELLDECIGDGEYDISSCYYDSPRDENIVGYCVESSPDWDCTQLHLPELLEAIEKAKTAFRDEFHREACVYLTPSGT